MRFAERTAQRRWGEAKTPKAERGDTRRDKATDTRDTRGELGYIVFRKYAVRHTNHSSHGIAADTMVNSPKLTTQPSPNPTMFLFFPAVTALTGHLPRCPVFALSFARHDQSSMQLTL